MEQCYLEMAETVGINISAYRKREKLTQLELALKVGMNSNYLSQIECGNAQKGPSLHILLKIANVLHVNLGDLFADNFPKKRPATMKHFF